MRSLSIQQKRSARRSRLHNPQSSRRSAPLELERLEDRLMLSTVTWDGGGTFNWNDAANSSTNATPNAADDVTVGDLGGATISVSGSAVAIHSLHTSAAIDVSGTSFSLAANSDVSSTLQVDTGGSLNLSGVTISGTGQIVNGVGSTLTAYDTTFNDAVVNDGTMVVLRGVQINGLLTTGAGSVIDILTSAVPA